MKKIAVLVATRFEDTELIGTIDIFSRANITYDLISVENLDEVKGTYNAIVKTIKLRDVNLNNYEGIFIPGGAGHEIILKNNEILNIIKTFDNQKKFLVAICAAPTILLKAKALDSKKFTSYPGFAVSPNNLGKDIVECENVITGKNMQATVKFAQAAVELWKKMH